MPRSLSRSGQPEAAREQPSGIAVEELRRLVRERRGKLSIRQAAEDAGVSFSTLSRVEAGAQPDLATFLQLCAWLGERPERFFRPNAQRISDTIDQVTSHLIADPRLSPDAAERIVSVVRDLYDALARDVQEPPALAMHLRAATVLRPGVPERLGSLLHDVHHALEQRLREGSL
jgi:transcriptional regulator with XRE-family HTH domain